MYQLMLEVLSFLRSGEHVTFFTKVNNAKFSSEGGLYFDKTR